MSPDTNFTENTKDVKWIIKIKNHFVSFAFFVLFVFPLQCVL